MKFFCNLNKNLVNLLSKTRFFETFQENRQVLQVLSKKLLPLSLTIPCFEECGPKKTICLFHSFPVCSCSHRRLLLIHMPSQQKRKDNTSTTPYIRATSTYHVLHVSIHTSIVYTCVCLYIYIYVYLHRLFFPQNIPWLFIRKQHQSTIKNKKTLQKNTTKSVCFVSKHQKKTNHANHSFFSHQKNNLNLKPFLPHYQPEQRHQRHQRIL